MRLFTLGIQPGAVNVDPAIAYNSMDASTRNTLHVSQRTQLLQRHLCLKVR